MADGDHEVILKPEVGDRVRVIVGPYAGLVGTVVPGSPTDSGVLVAEHRTLWQWLLGRPARIGGWGYSEIELIRRA